MMKVQSKKLILSRESLRLLDRTAGKHPFLGDPETQVGHSCDSFCYLP